MVGLVFTAAFEVVGQIWGNAGREVAGLVFFLGIAALTSWFRTRPKQESN